MIFKIFGSEKFKRKKMERLMRDFLNNSCIYFKNPFVCLGQFDNFLVDEEGLEITLLCRQAEGFARFPPQLSLYGVWPDLSVMKKQITCFEEGWHLFFDEKLIRDVLEISDSADSRDEVLMQITDCILNYLAGANDK